MNIALIGSNIKDSLSPTLYAELFSRHGFDGDFSLITIQAEDLGQIRAIASQERLDAFAVTMPHKQTIIKYIDFLQASAKVAGSVNLVTIKDGVWWGYSTDGLGFLLGLDADDIDIFGKDILIYGSGGAANSILAALAENTKKISIASRNTE
ncbi:MAG: shikimate dehydrogenase, partial [Clostridiales bacterium]|nr:shikimate dehydrogenase [Clostridiales bacterium]